MRLLYYASTTRPPLVDECNSGIEEVPPLLERVRGVGVPVEVIDTSPWTESQLGDAYIRAATPAVERHSRSYSVRRAFGTRRRGGQFFGRGVPALVVENDRGKVTDVYPHYEGERPVTIRDFLLRVLSDPTRLRAPGEGFGPQDVERLLRIRRRLAARMTDDSVAIIRAAREGR